MRHEVVHHDEADVAPHARLDSDEAEEAGYERVLAALHHVLVVVGQDLPQELGLLLRDRLDDELAVLGQVEDRAALAGRAELSQRVLAADGDHVLLRVHAEVLAQVAEGERRVVLEPKVLRRVAWSERGALRRELLLEGGLEVLLGELAVAVRRDPPDAVRNAQLDVQHHVPRGVALVDGLALLDFAVAHLVLRRLRPLRRRCGRRRVVSRPAAGAHLRGAREL